MKHDARAMGSDVARSSRRAWYRFVSRGVIRLLGLDRSTPLATEFCQAQNPIARISTPNGTLLCRGGHGRLVWRAESFFDEEPQTIDWLDQMTESDVLWDVGANVGMYAIYAARFGRCQVLAFEPEAQNYALLLENIVLNGVGDRCLPACVAISSRTEFGRLAIRYITRGGAYNHFSSEGLDDSEEPYTPAADENRERPAAEQLMYGTTIDALVNDPNFAFPTHIKIDVDGLEPDIIEGALHTLADRRLRGVLVEVNMASPRHRAIPDTLLDLGFTLVSSKSNWDYRTDRTRETEVPDTNMIFERA